MRTAVLVSIAWAPSDPCAYLPKVYLVEHDLIRMTETIEARGEGNEREQAKC